MFLHLGGEGSLGPGSVLRGKKQGWERQSWEVGGGQGGELHIALL